MAANIEYYGSATICWSIGVNHQVYEDCSKVWNYSNFLVKNAGRGEILVVCDGVGSAPKGRESAHIICNCVGDFFTSKKSESAKLVYDILLKGNLRVRSLGYNDQQQPLGTCAGTVAWIDVERKLHVYHVGDTRLMLIRGNVGIVLTTDHQNKLGHLKNYYGRSEIEFEYKKINLKPKDKILLFSDGITKVLSNKEIAQTVLKYKSQSAALNALENIARQRGALDDITILLFEEEEF